MLDPAATRYFASLRSLWEMRLTPVEYGYYTQYVPQRDRNISVRHALLALLSEGPKYGLQLQREFEAGTGEVWPLNVGQVYTTLQRLERDGSVESTRPPRTARRSAFASPLRRSDRSASGCGRRRT